MRSIRNVDEKNLIRPSRTRVERESECRKGVCYWNNMYALAKNDSVEMGGDGVKEVLHGRFVRRKQQRGAMDAEEARDLISAMRVRLWEHAGVCVVRGVSRTLCGVRAARRV